MKEKELAIFPTYKCNNDCIFCLSASAREKFRTQDPDPEKIKTQIETLARNEEETKLVLSGGEPTISPYLIDYLEFGKDKGVDKFEIQTNGRRLSSETLVKKLKKFDPTFFLSLHFASKKLYKKYTKADGFDQVIEGIKNLTKHNSRLKVNTIILRENLPELDELISLLIKMDVKKVQLKLVDGNDYDGDYKKIAPRYSECVQQIQNLIRKKSDKIKISLYDFPPCVMEKEFRQYLAPKTHKKDRKMFAPNGLTSEKEINKHRLFFPKDACQKCSKKDFCSGVRRRYLKVYGKEEFNPIKKTDNNQNKNE